MSFAFHRQCFLDGNHRSSDGSFSLEEEEGEEQANRNLTLALAFCLAASWAFFCLSLGGIAITSATAVEGDEEESKKKSDEALIDKRTRRSNPKR